MSVLTESHTFVVLLADTSLGNLQAWTGNTTSGNCSHLPYTDGWILEGWGSTTRQVVAAINVPDISLFGVYEIVNTGSEYTLKWNGTQFFTTGTNTVGYPNTNAHLGVCSFGTWQGKIAGMYQMSAKLGSTERTALINYINSRFGLSSS
jgi:hypothetical protein